MVTVSFSSENSGKTAAVKIPPDNQYRPLRSLLSDQGLQVFQATSAQLSANFSPAVNCFVGLSSGTVGYMTTERTFTWLGANQAPAPGVNLNDAVIKCYAGK
ncbi:hypothetical protein N7492_002350 [Penicillium capsulatum]|uniref:Uncharacterized protein n=1 Tax=Penicillium capsulatum TaxID=69766 RepID=A0A9W9LVL0_9EURO|nr:hypothetical protein N7492_002350 [Penicillium capsulatum]